MFKKILVPLDGSSASEESLRRADAMLKGHPESTLIVLRVLELPAVSAWAPIDSVYAHEKEEQMVKEYLASVHKERLAKDYKVETLMHPGPVPAAAIVQVAKEHEADLVMMTSHGRSGFARLLLGSVTERVIRSAECSVMVVR